MLDETAANQVDRSATSTGQLHRMRSKPSEPGRCPELTRHGVAQEWRVFLGPVEPDPQRSDSEHQ